MMAWVAAFGVVGCQSSDPPAPAPSRAAGHGTPPGAAGAGPAISSGDEIATPGSAARRPGEQGEKAPETAASPTPESGLTAPTPAAALREVFPGVRVDVENKLVEFDGMVPIDAHNPGSPRVYLEVIACTFDSKEHESLVVTRAKPSHVHAALLMIGLEPGSPGSWKVDGRSRVATIPPRGSAVRVSLTFDPGSPNAREIDPAELVINARTMARASSLADAGFVFAGSRVVEWQGRSFYDADGMGTLIGLATFGSETIAWREVFSPEAAIAEPEWIADNDRLPAAGTPVTVRLRPLGRITRTGEP